MTLPDAPMGSTILRRALVTRSWPVGPIHLLLQAGLAPETVARRAWAVWTETRDFERISDAEKRLLAAFSERIEQFDPSSSLRSQIAGATKLLWTRAKLTLTGAADAFDRLSSAEIPFVVFKGGALLAEGFATSRRRIIGDVDLLVRRESMERAIDALVNAGWSSEHGESHAYLRRLAQTRISGNYRKGEHGKVDLHVTPFHFAKSDRDLDGALWHHARSVMLAGREVSVPDAADAIVISLAHAPMSNSAEWAIDVAARIAEQPIDWNRVTDIAMRRGLIPSCLAGLRYLGEVLAVPVPGSALVALNDAPVPLGGWLKYWSNVSDRRDRNLVEKAANLYADLLLRGQGYSIFLKDRVEVTVTRPALPLGSLRAPRPGISVSTSSLEIRHEFLVTPDMPGSRMVIQIAVPRPPVSRRMFFDVTANGVAMARLRCRLRPSGRAERALTFVLPFPRLGHQDARVSIESRPTKFLPPSAQNASQTEFGAVRFRLLRAALR